MVVFNGEIIEYKRNINNDNEFLNEKHLDGFLISIVTRRLSFIILSAFTLGALAIAAPQYYRYYLHRLHYLIF